MEVGDQLPSERQISAEHGISRLTTRKALELLQNDGYVEAYQGIGSFVARSKPVEECRHVFVSFDERVRRLGMEPATRVVSCGIDTVSGDLAQRLGVREYSRFIKVRRLRYADDTAIALHTAYLPYAPCAPILDVDLENHALYHALEDDLNIQLAYADQTLRLVLGQPNDLALLGLEPPTVMLEHTQRTFDDLGRMVLYLKGLYRNDDYDLRPLL
jgi:GntR family transcriptional regulator